MPSTLFLLNHPFVAGEARAAAERLLAAGPAADAARLDLAFRAALGRPPAPAEAGAARDHLAAGEAAGEEPVERWAGVFQALFGSIDFRYLR